MDRETRLEYGRKYRESHREEIRKKGREYYRQNKKTILEKNKTIYKERISVRQKEYREKNRDYFKAYNHKKWVENKKEKTKYNHEYHRTHKKETSKRDKNNRIQWKIDFLLHYGGRCSCCGEKIFLFLSADHINGGGTKHSKETKGNIYRWAKVNGYPKILQTMCYNCNCGRYFNGGTCPHKDKKTLEQYIQEYGVKFK